MIKSMLIPACLLLVACQAQPPEPAPHAPQPSAAEAQALAADGEVTASYACQDGNTVDLVREGRVARLALSDGRTIRLGEIAGSQPHTWSDVGLRFVVDGDFIELSQSNGQRNLPCTAQ